MLLALASLLLVLVIAYQNIATPQLRELSISDGLYQEVPSFWVLDAAYLVMIVALCMTGHVLAIVAGSALLVTAVSNTLSVWVDKVTHGLHNKIHTYASITMFVATLALQVTQDHGWLWWLSLAGVLAPAAVYAVCEEHSLKLAGGPAAEKTAVLFLCSWMIAWGLGL